MIKRFFILLLAIVASVGMSWALPTVKYAVCNVPDGWAVTANGDAVSPINGRYYIADGKTVVLTPPASPEVGSVTSAEETGLLGTGTAEDPYLIYTVAHWNAVAAKVNDGTQAAPYCLQMANLDGVTTVMGNSESNPFKGIYDGNGFVFTNINLSITSGSNPLGLFGCVNDASAVIKNVVVAGGTVSSTSRNVGAIVGQLNGGIVQYCANYAAVSSSFDGAVRMGGIVGWMRSAGGDNNRVDYCINYGNVSGVAYAGGITGSCGAGYVSYCQNYGSISSSATSNEIEGSAGGIIGWYNPTTDASKITYNHNGGHVTEAVVSGYNPSRYIIANTNSISLPGSNSYLSSLTLTIGSDSYTGAELATHEPSAQALDINPEGITISGITYAYGVAAPIAPAPGTNPGTDPAQQSNKTWQFTMPSHNIGLTVIIYPAEVIAKIDALPNPVQESDLKLSVYQKVQDARAAYDALTAEQKALVTNLAVLEAAEAAFDALGGGGTGVEGLLTTITVSNSVVNHSVENIVDINQDAAELGENGWTSGMVVVSAKPGFTITRVRSFQNDGMFGGINDDTSSPFEISITNGMTLVKLEVYGYEALSPIAAAQAALALINAIPNPVTLDEACVKAIKDARAAVDALDPAALALIDDADMAKLTNAEAALTDLNQAEADKVIDKINNIPLPVELTLATRDSINNARTAYDALNAAQQALVTNYQTLLDAEAALAAYIYIPDGALNGKFTINAAGDQISFAKGNLQATTADLGETWTWGLAANQWEVIGGEVANTAITGSGTVSENGTVDLFGWSTPATYFGIYHTMDGTDYLGDFVDWGTNMGAGWRTLSITEWEYLLKTRDNAANLRGQATVNGVYGLILLPNDWTLPAGLTFTAMPNNWTTNVYADADWTAMENAGAVFLPIEGLRWEQTLYYADEGNYWSSTPAENYQSAEYVLVREETQILGGEEYLTDYGGRDNGISVRLAAVSVNPFDDAQAVKDMIDALPNPIDYFSKDAIKAARAAYDALADETKAALDEATVQHLIDAENQWAAIAAEIEHNVYYIGKDGELKNEKVALLNIPDPAPDFNGYEFDKWKVKTGRFLEEGLRIKALYTPIITTDPVAYDTLVFNRANQELVVAGIAEEGHIEYRIGEGEWSAELPKAMNAGTYEVTYKLVRDGHDDYISPNQISVTIAKTQVAFDAPAAYDTLTYNYNAQTLIAAGQTLDGTFEYTLNPTDAQSWSTELPQGMNAGLYGVNFRVIGDANHFDSIVETPIEILIAKRDIIVTAPAAYDTLVYNAQEQTLAIDGTADFNTMEYTLTPNDDNSWLTVMPTAKNAGSYDVYYRVPGDANHNDFEPQNITATIAQAPLTITAIDSTIIYGDEAPEFFATYSGWQGEDTEEVVSGLAYTCAYEQGSYVGTYAIQPNSATALNYAMTFVEGTLTVVKAAVYVSDAEVHIAKFEDNNTDAEVTDKGVLNGVKLNDPVDHITTAFFSSADVAEHLTITLFYELSGDSALLENYYLTVTSEVYTEEGVIIEQILPDNDHQPGETEQVEVKEGIDVYVFGYCDGSGYSLKYHLNRGIPDQYMIDFEDSRFTDVDWTNLDTPGKDGTIFVEIPVDLPTGDYNMSVQFRDSRFDWLESRQFDVTFHVNLPETYTMPLFGNAIALVDTCECFTDIQWYYRASSNDVWEPIPGATGYYCHVDGQLTGEYFVAAKMNGVETFTCPQTDMETLYEDDIQHVRVRAYPNPVIDKTNVVIENSIEWNHNLRIVNLMGVEMMTTTFEGNETSVEMSNYPQGNYMISVDGNVVKVMKK